MRNSISNSYNKNMLHGMYSSKANNSRFIAIDHKNANVVLSTRKIIKNYNGPCLRVRITNAVPAVEKDIGWIGDKLDEKSLNDFVGSEIGYVSIWYDQTKKNDAIQTLYSNQPIIINNGTFYRINNAPSIYFNGIFTSIKHVLNLTYDNKDKIRNQTTYCVTRRMANSSYGRLFTFLETSNIDYNTTNHFIPLLNNITSAELSSWQSSGIRSNISAPLNTNYIVTSSHNGRTLYNFINKNPSAAYSSTLNVNLTSSDNVKIGAYDSGLLTDGMYNGYISEIINYINNDKEYKIYNTIDEINNYYNIY